VNELVCLDLPLGDSFVTELRRAWDAGDAVFPLDQRLPRAAKQQLVEGIAPTRIVDAHGASANAGRPVEAGDALVVATSGSTGHPKAAVLTHEAVRASAVAVHARLGAGPGDTWFACLPPAHVGGLSVVTRSIVTGTRLVTSASFSPEAFLSAARDGATLVSLVPTALLRVDPSVFRIIVLGGSRPPSPRPPNCVATYGLTETGSGVVYDGRPLDGVETKIVAGIIHLRGPMLMRSYRDGSSTIDTEGWLRTGDMGSLDNDGMLRVDGREGDLIITGGENVWPEPVEAAIDTHPGVIESCVVGIDDPEWGQAVHAFVVARDEISLESVREHVKATLPAHCAPKHLHVVRDIPRTALGKPMRSVLAASLG
jgi:O-succinylbenzoic acid--CoA ligase